MSSLRVNTLANFVGRGWSALLDFLFLPIYIGILGVESWGLVGFFALLVAVLNLMDLGLSSTLNRELARLSAQESTEFEQRDLLRTLEVIYWIVALLLGLVIFTLAPLIVRYWLNSENLASVTVITVLRVMGLVFIFRFPFALYQGGLMGIQRQVLFNSILVGGGTVRNLGAVVILWWVAPTIEAYFLWQLVVGIIQTVLTRSLLWKVLPRHKTPPQFQMATLSKVWRYAAGVTGIMLLSVLLNQLDKIILLKMLPLKEFGYYALAMTVSGALYMGVTAVQRAVFPRMSEYVAAGDEEAVTRTYHQACQVVSVLAIPPSLVIMVYAQELLLLWTGDLALATHTSPALVILVAGTTIHCLLHVPFSLQLAYGWTSLTIKMNLALLTVVVPLQVALTYYWGGVGAATAWTLLKCIQMCVVVVVMHQKILTRERVRWCLQDIGVPLLATVVGMVSVFPVLRGTVSPFGQVLAILVSSAVALGAAALATSFTRRFIVETLKKFARVQE